MHGLFFNDKENFLVTLFKTLRVESFFKSRREVNNPEKYSLNKVLYPETARDLRIIIFFFISFPF